MLEIAFIILAVSNILWWAVVWFWLAKPEHSVQQPPFVLQDRPEGWTCAEAKCPMRGFVLSSVSDRPLCSACGQSLFQVQGYHELTERVARLVERLEEVPHA